MSAKDFNCRTQTAKPDDFIQDYLSDIWGLPVASAKTTQAIRDDEELSFIAFEPIERRFSLVPTLKYPCGELRTLLAQGDLLILIFNYLYLLRRPLSPRVRQLILELTAQVIEDFQAGFWINRLSAQGGSQ